LCKVRAFFPGTILQFTLRKPERPENAFSVLRRPYKNPVHLSQNRVSIYLTADGKEPSAIITSLLLLCFHLDVAASDIYRADQHAMIIVAIA
jgi:hypothetical protein